MGAAIVWRLSITTMEPSSSHASHLAAEAVSRGDPRPSSSRIADDVHTKNAFVKCGLKIPAACSRHCGHGHWTVWTLCGLTPRTQGMFAALRAIYCAARAPFSRGMVTVRGNVSAQLCRAHKLVRRMQSVNKSGRRMHACHSTIHPPGPHTGHRTQS